MDIYCDRFTECNSVYLDRGPETEKMAQARGWVIFHGQTMGGKEHEVTLCDKCTEASRRAIRRDKYVEMPDQYPIPELKIVKPGE